MNRFLLTGPFFFLILIGWLPCLAQDSANTIGNVSIASPTAASLGKYGDIPVSYHTGIPQIGIPVYTVQSGSLKLPISLSYHASGLKVQESASWVGAGWSLNAGGVITRTVVGAADDRGNNTGYIYVTNGYYTDFGFYSYMNAAGYSTPDDVSFQRGVKDGEPDLYFFNFGGYSGKFYFNDDRTPVLVPDQDIKIQPFFTLGPGFTGFIVTTPDGQQYYFGQKGNDNPSVNPVEETVASTTQAGYSASSAATSAWYLNKIISADGMDSINLSYQAESYSYYTLSTFPVVNSNYVPNGAGSSQVGMNVVKNFVTGVRLSHISFPNGQITFTPSATAREDLSAGSSVNSTFTDATNTSAFSLGSITISNNLGFCQKDSLYYGYFQDTASLEGTFLSFYNTYSIHSDEYKLRLDSLKESSCDGTLTVPPHKFSYFTETVPRRLSLAIDHWGYANGATANTTLVPTFTVVTPTGDTTYSGATRDAVWPAMLGGALQQITYPTGGSTRFSFGPKASYSVNQPNVTNTFLTEVVVETDGQDDLTTSNNFTVAGNGCQVTLSATYKSGQNSPTITVTNSSNATVYENTFSANYQGSINLPGGTYTATLAVSTGSPQAGGAVIFYQNQVGSTPTTLTVGGLRIDSVITSDAMTSNNIVTTYNYLDSSSLTNAILYSIPTYVQVVRNAAEALVWPYCSPNGCASCDGYNGHEYYISPGSIRPMSTEQGENLGYNEVDVTQTGNGKSIYKYYGSNLFSNAGMTDVCVRFLTQSSTCSASIPVCPAPPVPFEPMRGELSYEGQVNQAGQVLKESYYYPVYVMDSLLTPGHICINVPFLVSYTDYNLQSAHEVQNKVVQNSYDPVSGTELTSMSTVYYGSVFHHQPTRKVTTTSTGDSLATNTQYVMDFRIPSCDAVPDSLPYYMTTVQSDSNWMNSNVVSCTPQVFNTTNCRATVFTTFREMQMQARQQFIAYRRRSFAPDTSNLVSACYLTALSTADTLLKPVLRLQNMYDNVPIETSQWKDLNLLHASYLRYDSSISPRGYAYPGRTKLINLQAPSGTFTSAAVSGNTIAKDSRYVDETYYSFVNGNPLQVLPRSGVTTSYIWDYLNTEPIARVTNAVQADIAYTSFEANGTGNWTVPAGRDNSNAFTGSSSYNLSSGNITSSGLTSTTTYIVSYWSKTGNSYTVSGSTGYTQGKTIAINSGNWTYFEHTVTGVTGVTVSGSSGGDIDELRLYPATAQMTTYTYSPLLGVSSQCDVDNRVTYYYYDVLGRLRYVKDQDGNILKTLQYHYQGQ
jgi:hypothetical protein